MSIKENVSYIKEEIQEEEKMLEGLIRFEGWFKRYKRVVAAVLLFIFASWVALNAYAWYQESRTQKIYALYEELLQNPDNEDLLTQLRASKSSLYELFLFHRANHKNDAQSLLELEHSQNEFIAALAQYQRASILGNQEELTRYAEQEKPLFMDMARFSHAYLLMNEGKVVQAKELLALIPETSLLKEIAGFLEHFGIKEKIQ